MFFLAMGLLILILGIYYIPVKEAYFVINKNIPKWFYLILGVWVITSIIFVPFTCYIFLEGLVKMSYIEDNQGAFAVYFTMIVSLLAYFAIYRKYSTKLEKELIKLKGLSN